MSILNGTFEMRDPCGSDRLKNEILVPIRRYSETTDGVEVRGVRVVEQGCRPECLGMTKRGPCIADCLFETATVWTTHVDSHDDPQKAINSGTIMGLDIHRKNLQVSAQAFVAPGAGT